MTITFPSKPDESDRRALFAANMVKEHPDVGALGPHYQLPDSESEEARRIAEGAAAMHRVKADSLDASKREHFVLSVRRSVAVTIPDAACWNSHDQSRDGR